MSKVSIKKAVYINMIAKYSNIVVTLVFSAVLARILTPADYGVIAVVTVFTTFFAIIADMGMGAAVIQNKKLDKNDENSIFSFSLVLGIILMVIFIALGKPVAMIYHNDAYVKIFPILAISVLFNALNMVPNANLIKDKKFLRLGIRTISINIITFSIAVVMALNGFKYYSLVAQSVAAAVLIFVWNYWGTGLKITKIKKDSILKIRNFFAYQFAYEILYYFSRNIDNLLLGRVVSKRKLGYYDKGYRLMLYPINNLTYAITPALHSTLSDYQHNKEYIYEQYIKIVKILSLLGLYITTICFFASDEIILIMFGSQWKPAILCFHILSISVWAQIVSSSATSIYKSLGKTNIMLASGICHISVTVLCIVAAVFSKDINIVAIGVTIGLWLKFFIEYFFLIKKAFIMSLKNFYKIFIPDILITVGLVAVLLLLRFVPINNIVISAVVKVAVSGIVFLILLVVTKQFKYINMILPKKVRGLLKRFER